MAEIIAWTEEQRDIASLKAYDRNPRKISDFQFQALKTKILAHGYHTPIAIQPDGTIISGHQRAKALKELGFDKVRVSVPERALNEQEFREMMMAGNITDGEFDFGILSADFDRQELLTLGVQPSLMKEFDKQLRAGAAEPDEVPEPRQKITTRLGDLWLCADHRVMCGDSTNAESVTTLLDGRKPNLMVTDPPYGVEYDANWRNEADRSNGKPYGARAIGKVENDDRADWSEAWALFPGNIAYIWHASLQTDVVKHSIEQYGFKSRSLIIWAKSNFAIGRGDYHWQHDPCWYAVRAKGDWTGDRSQTTVWNIDKPMKSETGHSTQKPIECMQKPMLNNSRAGDEVYDPFLGSGTSLIAAHMAGRKCIGMELSPAYVDVIVRRWQKFTGLEAINATTGETFDSAEAA